MAPSPSSGLRRPAPLLAVEAAVDQANHGARALRVRGPVVPVGLAQAFVAAGAPDAVLDHDALPREGPVVGFVLLRLLLPTRLASRRRAAPMQFVDARIALVAPDAALGRHAFAQPAARQQRDVGCRPRTLSDTSTIFPVSGSTATWTFTVCAFFLPE